MSNNRRRYNNSNTNSQTPRQTTSTYAQVARSPDPGPLQGGGTPTRSPPAAPASVVEGTASVISTAVSQVIDPVNSQAPDVLDSSGSTNIPTGVSDVPVSTFQERLAQFDAMQTRMATSLLQQDEALLKHDQALARLHARLDGMEQILMQQDDHLKEQAHLHQTHSSHIAHIETQLGQQHEINGVQAARLATLDRNEATLQVHIKTLDHTCNNQSTQIAHMEAQLREQRTVDAAHSKRLELTETNITNLSNSVHSIQNSLACLNHTAPMDNFSIIPPADPTMTRPQHFLAQDTRKGIPAIIKGHQASDSSLGDDDQRDIMDVFNEAPTVEHRPTGHSLHRSRDDEAKIKAAEDKTMDSIRKSILVSINFETPSISMTLEEAALSFQLRIDAIGRHRFQGLSESNQVTLIWEILMRSTHAQLIMEKEDTESLRSFWTCFNHHFYGQSNPSQKLLVALMDRFQSQSSLSGLINYIIQVGNLHTSIPHMPDKNVLYSNFYTSFSQRASKSKALADVLRTMATNDEYKTACIEQNILKIFKILSSQINTLPEIDPIVPKPPVRLSQVKPNTVAAIEAHFPEDEQTEVIAAYQNFKRSNNYSNYNSGNYHHTNDRYDRNSNTYDRNNYYGVLHNGDTEMDDFLKFVEYFKAFKEHNHRNQSNAVIPNRSTEASNKVPTSNTFAGNNSRPQGYFPRRNEPPQPVVPGKLRTTPDQKDSTQMEKAISAAVQHAIAMINSESDAGPSNGNPNHDEDDQDYDDEEISA